MPAVHSWHSAYIFLSWYLPVGQWKQLVWPVHGAYLPVLHFQHLCAVVGRNWPLGQSRHSYAPAMAYRPLSHAVHSAVLYTAENWPAAQGVHTEKPASL